MAGILAPEIGKMKWQTMQAEEKFKKLPFFLKLSASPPSNYAVPTVIIIIICFILHLSIEFRTFFSKNQILEPSTEKKKAVLKACFIKGNFTAQRIN